jgi:hypothetical protein
MYVLSSLVYVPQKENNTEQRESFLRQTCFSLNNNTVVAWKYVSLRSSAVQRFSDSEQFAEDG